MPTFYNFRENGLDYSFDDVFIPTDLFRDGTLWVWGNGFNGILGTSKITNINTPATTFSGGSNWKQVSCGKAVEGHTATIKTDGTLWVWGSNSLNDSVFNSGLGINFGGPGTISTPVTTFAGGANWKQVSCGAEYTAAVKTDGTLWVWGNRASAKLGNNSDGIDGGYVTPVTTFAGGTNWKQVSCGNLHTTAIKTDGTLWVWGNNGFGGALGFGSSNNSKRSTPVTTFAGGTNWKQVSNNGSRISNIESGLTAAIKTDGTLWVWGNGLDGKLGTNSPFSKSTPVTTFAGGTNWKQVSCGDSNIAAIKTDGTLWVWGNGATGRLGNNFTVDRSTPVTTFAGGTNWKQVSCGDSHTAAVKTDGTLWVWGNGANGQLGTNDITTRLTPVTTFAGGKNWKQVSCGALHTVATKYIDPIL